jgi:iron complex outermembrane receptor protein
LIDKYLLSADLRYALTNSSQQKLFGPYTADIVGKQLIYVPRHVVSSTASVSKNNLSLTVQQQFTSERHITFDHSGRPFPPYYLLNVVLNYQIKKPKTQIDIAVQGNNLTNTLYPNVKKNAMPLRTVSLNVVFHF